MSPTNPLLEKVDQLRMGLSSSQPEPIEHGAKAKPVTTEKRVKLGSIICSVEVKLDAATRLPCQLCITDVASTGGVSHESQCIVFDLTQFKPGKPIDLLVTHALEIPISLKVVE